MSSTETPITNIFEKALVERYIELGVGNPDRQLLDVIERAAEQVTNEVKVVLSRHHDFHRARKRKVHKELSGSKDKTSKG